MTNEEAQAAGEGEYVEFELDENTYRLLEELAKANGVTQEEELRLLIERELEKSKMAEADK